MQRNVFSMSGLLELLRRDESGAIAIMFGLAMLPLMLAVGSTLDYNNASRIRASVSAAADAAALAGVKAAVDNVAANGSSAAAFERAQTVGSRVAAEVFRSTLAGLRQVSVETPRIEVKVSAAGAEAVVRGVGRVETSVLSIVGVSEIPVSVLSRAEMGARPFAHLAFLLDTSQSMGIGATEDTIRRMILHPQITCAFACHNTNLVYGQNTLPVARAAGFAIKLDFVRNSVLALVDRIERDAIGDRFQFTLATFATYFRQPLTRSSNLSLVRRHVSDIELELADNFPFQDFSQVGWTDIAGAMTSFLPALRSAGDGSSVSSPQTHVVLITDGLQDFPRQHTTFLRATNTEYENECRALSRNGLVEVFVIHTPTPYFDQFGYRDLIEPHQADATRKLQNCATSPQHFFLATDGPAVQRAIDSITRRFSAMPRLTN